MISFKPLLLFLLVSFVSIFLITRYDQSMVLAVFLAVICSYLCKFIFLTPEVQKSEREEYEEEMKNIRKDMKKLQRIQRETLKTENENSKQLEENRAKVLAMLKVRSNAVHELLDTEKAYVEKLNVIVEVFQRPMTQAAVATQEQIQHIFSNLESIREFNGMLLQKLESNLDPEDGGELSEVFLKMADFLKLYIIFINNFTKGMETLKECKQRPKFASFLDNAFKNPRCEYLDLNSLLIMPVQRIPRYILLLNEIYKNTPKDRPDHQTIGHTLVKVKEIAESINTARRNAESLSRMHEISKLVEHLHQPLVLPTRRLELEGELQVSRGTNSKVETSYFFLFNDILMETKKKGKLFNFKGTTPVNSLKIQIEAHNNVEWIHIGNDLRVSGNTKEETEKWMNALGLVTKELSKKKSSVN